MAKVGVSNPEDNSGASHNSVVAVRPPKRRTRLLVPLGEAALTRGPRRAHLCIEQAGAAW